MTAVEIRNICPNIQKIITIVEEARSELGHSVNSPTRRTVALSMISNPFADRYEDGLSPRYAIDEEFGLVLAERAAAARRGK